MVKSFITSDPGVSIGPRYVMQFSEKLQNSNTTATIEVTGRISTNLESLEFFN